MNFLQRLSGGLKNNTSVSETAITSRKNYGFNSNALEQYNLANDTFTKTNHFPFAPTQNPSTREDYLAFQNPVKFINKYVNNEVVENALQKNPNIKTLLKENGLDCKYNLNNVNSIIMSHLIPTSTLTQKIYTKMGHLKSETNYLHLTQAALLHDIGKAFIPSEILNKKGKLTKKEREIIELHNKLSYEILKTTNLNPKVAQLAYEHHNYENNLKRSEENQALTISDVYCALREKRPYKNPISDIGAKAILYDMGTKGKLDTRYINYINS